MAEDTVTLQWPRETDFVDYQTDQRYEGSGVYEVPAKWEALYRRRGWEDPPEDHDGDADTPTAAINRNLEGPSRDELEGASPDEAADNENADGGGDSGN